MKTFYEIADIRDEIDMIVEIKFSPHLGDDFLVGVSINSPYLADVKIKEVDMVMDYVPLMDPINIKLQAKKGSVHIDSILVDGFEVIPKYQHLSDLKTAFLNEGDVWNIDIPAPFYPWYHEITGHGWII